MTSPEEIAKIMLKIKGITFNLDTPYRFTSGIISPVYTDCRLLISYPEERKVTSANYVSLIKKLVTKVDVIAATATAGIPHGAWVAEAMNLPMVYVRGEAKGHGKQNQIEGVAKKGQQAVIIEDHISTGKSSVETATALRKSGIIVNHIFSITTYGMKVASNNYDENKLTPHSQTSFETVVSVASKLGYIKENEQNVVLEWTKDPQRWGKEYGFE